MKSGGSTQVKQLTHQLTVTNKHDGRTTGWSDGTGVFKKGEIDPLYSVLMYLE